MSLSPDVCREVVVGGAPGEPEDDAKKGDEDEAPPLPPPTNPARLAAWKVVTHGKFDTFILTCIVINCFFMAIEDPVTCKKCGRADDGPGSGWEGHVMYFDMSYAALEVCALILLWIFTIESFLKNAAFTPWGYFFGPDAAWNRLDFTVVVAGWLEIYPDYLGAMPFNLSFLRLFRVFRPLRTLGKMGGMKQLINTLFLCFDPLVDVVNLTIFVFFVFSVLGMQLFGGQGSQRCIDVTNWDEATQTGTWSIMSNDVTEPLEDRRCGGEFTCPYVCTDSDGTDYACSSGDVGAVKYECYHVGYNPYEGVVKQNQADGIIGYDNLGQAMLTVFVFCTAEGWVDGMYQFQDSFNWAASTVYHTLMMMLGNMFCMSLALAIIADTFEEESGGDDEEGEEGEDDDEDKEDEQAPKPDHKVLALLHTVAYDKRFDLFIVFMIVCNTVTLALEHSRTACLAPVGIDPADSDMYGALAGSPPDCIEQAWVMSDNINDILFVTNYIFVFTFAGEAAVKLPGMGPKYYFKDPFNTFDFTIVAISFLEMGLGLKGMTALRCFRLLRLFKMAKSWGSLRAIIVSLLKVLPAMTSLTIMLVLYMFIAAVAGMGMLGDFIPYSSRSRFTDFGVAMLTIFQMLTGENWNEVMFESIIATGQYYIVIYFLLVVIVGNFLVLNLFLAIMLSDFSCGEPPDFSFGALKQAILGCLPCVKTPAAPEGGDGAEEKGDDFFTPAQLARIKDADGDDTKKARERVRSQSATRKEEMEKQGKHGSAEMVVIQNDLRKQRHEEAERIRNALVGKSLGLFDTESPFRRACMKICRHPWFESYILFAIIFGSVCLAIDGPENVGVRSAGWKAIDVFDFVFVISFTVEMLLKIVTNGFYFCPEGYLKDPWNILDFVVVIVAWISADYWFMANPMGNAGSGLGALRTLRSLRALRPLRTIQRMPGMRLVVSVLFECFPVFVNICMVVLFFFLVFAIMGVQFFAGRFWYCNDGNVNRVDQCWGCFEDEEGSNPTDACGGEGSGFSEREWANQSMHFDNVFSALLTLYEVAGLEMWLDVMYAAMDTRPMFSRNVHGYAEFPYGANPKQENNWPAALFFVLFILFGVFVVMNLFTGAVVDKFNELKDANGGKNPLQTEEQSQYTESMALMARMRPFKVALPPKRVPKNATGLMKTYAVPIFNFRMWCYKVVMWDTSGKGMGTTFDMCISGAVMVNCLIMGMGYWKRLPRADLAAGEYPHAYMTMANGGTLISEYQETPYYNTLEALNNVFSLFFLVELMLKVTAWGFSQYIADMWNQLDFVLVLSSVAAFIIEVILSSGNLPINPSVFRIVRTARLTRALKSLRMMGRIKGIARLVDTLVLAIPAMANVASLCFLVIFIFAVMGMDFYGSDDIEQVYVNGGYNEWSNFRNFGDAFMLLFRATTGEWWNGVMHDIMVAECDQSLNVNNKGVQYVEGMDGYDENFCGAKHTTAVAYFTVFTVVVGGLLFELITAIVLDEFGKMNDSEKLPVNGDMISNFNDHWAQLDPKATQLIPQHKLLPFLKSVEPPIFVDRSEAAKEIFKMNIAATEGKGGVLMVHYVDTLVAVVRYQYVKKLGDEVGADLDVTMIESPELTTRIVSAYPHLKKIEKMDPKDFKTELAATKMQNMWMRRKAGTRIKAKRHEMEVELAVRKGSQKGRVPPEVAALSAYELTKQLRESEPQGTV